MASFSQTIQGKYGVGTYQETKKTYDWIMKSLNKGEFSGLKIETEFLFKISDIICKCSDISEFIEYAYGQATYHLISMDFYIKSNENPLWLLSVKSQSLIYVSTDTKNSLEKIVNLLRNTSLSEVEVNGPTPITYIGHQDNSVTINENQNVVASNHSTIVSEPEQAGTKIGKWLQGIGQGLLVNWIWYILGLAAVAIISWLASKGVTSG